MTPFYEKVYAICLTVGTRAVEVVVISNDTALRTGETALLVCVGFGEPEVEISWSFNGAPVVNASLITIYEEDLVQGERIFKQFFLQICNLAESDAGGYTCIASNGFTTDNATTQLTVTRKFINACHVSRRQSMYIEDHVHLFLYRLPSTRVGSDIQ